MLAVLQLTVGERTGGVDVSQCTGGESRALGGTDNVLGVALGKLDLLCCLFHLGGDILCHLLVGAACRGYLFIALGVVDTFVGHDGHRTVAAEQQPVVVGANEAGLTLVVDAVLGCHLGVLVDIVDEDRSLIDALIAIVPSLLVPVLAIVAELQGVV